MLRSLIFAVAAIGNSFGSTSEFSAFAVITGVDPSPGDGVFDVADLVTSVLAAP